MVLCPEAAVTWAPVGGAVAVVNVLYGALCAAAQDDLKYIVAYSSVSHMGVVMLGAATLTPVGWNGAVFQMFAHGIMTGLFFAWSGWSTRGPHPGSREDGRLRARDAAIAAFFTLGASPRSACRAPPGFVAEFLVFLGAATGRSAWWTVPGGARRFVTAVYVLRASKIIFWGPRPQGEVLHLSDPRRTEWAAPVVLCACLVVFGFWPRLLLDVIDATDLRVPRTGWPWWRRCSGDDALAPAARAGDGGGGPSARSSSAGTRSGPAGAGCGAGSRWSCSSRFSPYPR
jgi:NADH-quinone oxidoreductase subunit M